MEGAEFIRLATEGDEREALVHLRANPQLAAARDVRGVSIVCLAVYRRRVALASALAAARSDLDMFEAVCVGDLERVVGLARQDAGNVNAISPDGFSALGYAAFFGHLDVLRALIQRGAEVNAASRNIMRVCPLHSAAAHADQSRAVELARSLLDAGADPNAQQQGGYTPLHEAAQSGKTLLIELLLSRGASPSIQSDDGMSPIELARKSGRDAALQRLERAAAS